MNVAGMSENRTRTAAPSPAAGLPARPVDETAAGGETAPVFVLARVRGTLGRTVVLEIAGENRAAVQAASCLLSPQAGDVVMCSASHLGIHVLHILKRSEHERATISAPGAKRLVLEQPAIDLRTEDFDASAVRARVTVEHLHLFSRLVAAVTGGFELVADRIKRIARLEATSTGDSVRTVRNSDTLRAGHIVHEASEVMSLRSDVAIIEARGDVRVNGERVSVG